MEHPPVLAFAPATPGFSCGLVHDEDGEVPSPRSARQPHVLPETLRAEYDTKDMKLTWSNARTSKIHDGRDLPAIMDAVADLTGMDYNVSCPIDRPTVTVYNFFTL